MITKNYDTEVGNKTFKAKITALKTITQNL
jgi:hypothetical protein